MYRVEEEEIALLEVGTVLCAKDTQEQTNAIIIEMGFPIKILTDFGNIIKRSTVYDILDYYEVSDHWLEAKEIDYPLPNIRERIQKQIALLQQALVVTGDLV